MSLNRVVKISVRSLVEFVLRSGDLIAAFTGSARMIDGGKIHRWIQKSQSGEYNPEVGLAIMIERPEVKLQISGRADGIIITKDAQGVEQVIIDEIKSTTLELDEVREYDNPLYWAQAKCYAYMYCSQHGLEEIGVQLTYCQANSLAIKTFAKVHTIAELGDFFNLLVAQYLLWARRTGDWLDERDSSAQELQFPYSEFRAGQRQLAVAVYKTITNGKKLYAQAPTGTGKTMATLFPAVKALGNKYIDKIFYLTAKTVTRELAEDACARLRQGGLKLKTITITAKDKICFMPAAACVPEECPYAKGYYDRINETLADCWQTEDFNREVIESYAHKHRVCPFELSLDLSLWADVVICDYNYVFDPRVSLKRFFAEGGGEYCFLVDEAHNLVDRARGMFSAEINKTSFQEFKKSVKNKLPKLAKSAGKITTFLTKAGKQCKEGSLPDQAEYSIISEQLLDIIPLLRNFADAAEEWLRANEKTDFRDSLLEIYFSVNAFLRTSDMYDERFTTYIEKPGKDIKLKLFCINPAELLRKALLQGRAAILFSATLSPLNYFFEVLGGGEDDAKLAVASPFENENLGLLIADNVNTTYKKRVETYDAVVELLSAAVAVKAGNYLVFFPSHKYMEEVFLRFTAKNPSVTVVRQTGEMPEEVRAQYLEQFSEPCQSTLVGFAVLGGIFGEGIDLTGERLIGAIIVGVGLPKVCLEQEIIKNWFESNSRQGFEYAYVYPGMNKVLQAAGRVIRTEQDRGIVLLIDERYAQARYRRLFPAEWRGAVRVKTATGIIDKAHNFWTGT